MERVLGVLLLAVMPAVSAAAELIDVHVYDRTARCQLPVYAHGDRLYVAAIPGNEYSIRLRNRTGEDVLAVVSVDGVNAVTGETAAPAQGGYIIGGGQRFDVKGWRKSLEHVAAFYFSARDDAYAVRTGRPDDIGVIGVAVFRRKAEPPAVDLPRSERDAAKESSGAPAARADESARRSSADAEAPSAPARLGTGHGARTASTVRYAQFERATAQPEQLIAIEYDSRENLLARGIIPALRRTPQPFPAQFVPDPPRG